MAYIFLAFLFFALAVTAHISYCRKTTQSGLQAKAFIFIAMFCLGIYAWAAELVQQSSVFLAHPVWGLPFKITAGLIFILLVPIYLCFYVLTQLTSPSKKILESISRHGTLTHADILGHVEKENFINTRLSDLCASGCVMQNNGRYSLTSEGQKIAAILNMMQLILGRNVGG